VLLFPTRLSVVLMQSRVCGITFFLSKDDVVYVGHKMWRELFA